MKRVNRDVTIPFLMLSIVVIIFNEMAMGFDVKFILGISIFIGLLLYWIHSSKEMAILSALLSGNFIFICLKYKLIDSLIGLIALGIILAGSCALMYNIISDDNVSKRGSRSGLFKPISFMAFGATLFLSNLLFIE